MIPLLDTPEDLAKCAQEIGRPVGQLLTPCTRYTNRATPAALPAAIDNGAFGGFDAARCAAFLALLRREEPNRDRFLFVAVPDVVGSARRTLEVWDHWSNRPELSGWPLAFVCQDGQEDLPIPWPRIKAVFIGGETRWKLGPHPRHIIRAAQALGKHVHIGRINTPDRWSYFEAMEGPGGVPFTGDAPPFTADGTGIARYTWMREAIAGVGGGLFAEEGGGA